MSKFSSIKKKIQISLDVIMLITLIILMCEHTISDLIHEVLGILILCLFVLHNILNFRWYKIIFSKKVNKRMIPSIIINSLILIVLILTMISSFMISGYVFKDLITNSKVLGRSLHMVFSIWLFILICMHFGYHLNKIVWKFKKNLIFKIIETIIITTGLIVMIFIDHMYEEMFFLTSFKNYNEQSFIIDILKKIVIALSISLITFNLNNLIRRKTKNEKI